MVGGEILYCHMITINSNCCEDLELIGPLCNIYIYILLVFICETSSSNSFVRFLHGMFLSVYLIMKDKTIFEGEELSLFGDNRPIWVLDELKWDL